MSQASKDHARPAALVVRLTEASGRLDLFERLVGLSPHWKSVEKLVARDGVNGFHRSLEAHLTCCAVHKVALLGRALAGVAAWLTRLRADQSQPKPAGAVALTEILTKTALYYFHEQAWILIPGENGQQRGDPARSRARSQTS
jgi:hypothetical protein